ncbi:DnaJ homolog subfamily C member 7 [Talaromyces islandicus]|uniref:DnaJ homolog subfamily C member 7 n=1 Tax=Talaromyces islandicus TaxID=28573 RepID=A0A0U1LRR1_TALIS|nr:DnaJ homolog subfamily C member 7 [Talaromyces islandicus]
MVLQFFSKSPSPDKPKDKDKAKDNKPRSSRSKKDKDAAKSREKEKEKSKSKSKPTTAIPQLKPDRNDDELFHNDEEYDPPEFSSKASSPQKSASTSPRKPHSPTKPPSLSYRDSFRSHSRSSSAASSKHNFFSANSRSSQSRDSHPLNLPPDELRRHLFAMTAAREDSMRSSMDLDRDATASPQPQPDAPTPMSTNGVANGDAERSPTPPPHRASPPTSDGGESFKLAGNKFFKQGEYDRAIQEYNKALEVNPNSSIFLSNRAAAFLAANRFLEALEDAQRALELDPGNAKIMHRMARILTNLGRPAEALEVLSNVQPPATAKDRSAPETMLKHITQAEQSLADGKGGSLVVFAIEQARQMLGSGAKTPRKWTLMTGEAQLLIGNDNAYGKAHDVAISLLRENNQDPDALLLRARAYYGQGDNDQAVKYLKMCLGLDPDSKQAIKLLRQVQKLVRTKDEGNAAFKAKNYQRAVELYTQGLEIDPSNKDTNSKLLNNRAQARHALKDYEKAIEDCTEALRLDPGYVKAQKIRAKAYGASGNWEEAVKDYKNVAEANPGEKGIQEDIRHAEFELKKSKRKDYYKLLGVSKDASDTDIKKAYRKMAIQYHPDKNPDSTDEMFKEIGEAYETLIDPQKRAAYDNGDDLVDPADMFGHGGSPFGGMGGMGGMPGGMGGGMHGVNIDPNILFNMMNGGGGGFAHAGGNPFAGAQGRGGGFQNFQF